MKLWFYILDSPYNKEPFIRCEECEVEEKPKTYKPVDSFPCGVYRSYINKSDIGHISGCSNNCVVLKEKNNALAKDIFSMHMKTLINGKKREIEKMESKLNAVLELED